MGDDFHMSYDAGDLITPVEECGQALEDIAFELRMIRKMMAAVCDDQDLRDEIWAEDKRHYRTGVEHE